MDLLRSMKNLIGGEGIASPGASVHQASSIPLSETSLQLDRKARTQMETDLGSIPLRTYHCPERGEEFDIYARTLERDFKAYDPGITLEHWLGSGGFCDVFYIPEINTDSGRRRAVLRVLRPTRYRTPDPRINNRNIQLFMTEIGYNIYLSSQNVPNVVKMYDFGFFGRNPDLGRGSSSENLRHLYMLMEYVEGDDVSHHWSKAPSDERELMKRVVLINLIAGILGDLHFRGIIHCDIKPTNILLRGGSTPVLSDFGAARWMNVKNDVLAPQHLLSGTYTYMSYEQLQGDIFNLDQRTDIFSLAVLACYAFTGHNPFNSRSDIQIEDDNLLPLAAVDPDVPKIPYRGGDALRSFLLECLSRDIDQRPNSMVAFQNRLNSWILQS